VAWKWQAGWGKRKMENGCAEPKVKCKLSALISAARSAVFHDMAKTRKGLK